MNYFLPTKFISGENTIINNADKIAAFGKHCLIVTGGNSAKRCGALDDVLKALEMHGIKHSIYDAVKPNPTIECVIEGGRFASQEGCDFVIGIGGGSPLDAAKVIAISAANPELDRDGLYSMNWPNKRLPLVLVGTTAGTGSEMTPISVITDLDGRKRSFKGDSIYADLSMGDARYTMSMPLSVTTSTAVDALAHCLESYFSKNATAISRGVALEGMLMLKEPLKGLAEGKLPSEEERHQIYDASILGGIAISITATNLGHNLGYYLTESHNVPHGFACASFLPALLDHVFECAPEYAAELCRLLNMSKEEFATLIKTLTPDFGVKLSAEEIEALLPRWENVPNLQATLGGVTIEEVRKILTEKIG